MSLGITPYRKGSKMKFLFKGSKDLKQLIGGTNATPGQIKGIKLTKKNREFIDIMERHPTAFEIRTPYNDMDPVELEMIEKAFGDDTKDLFYSIKGNAPPKPSANPYAEMTKKQLYEVVEINDLEIEDYKKMNLAPLCEAVTEAMVEE